MLKSPFDIVVVFAIIALVVITMGLGIESISEQGANTGNTTFFSDVETDVYSSTGLKGTSDEASKVIDPSDNPVTAEASEEGIITQGLQSLRSISSTYKSTEKVLEKGSASLAIPQYFWEIIASVVIIMIFVIIYTWARGR